MYRTAVECLRKNRLENENFQQFIEVTIKLLHNLKCVSGFHTEERAPWDFHPHLQ